MSVVGGLVVGGIDFMGVVTTTVEFPNFLVGHIRDHFTQFGVFTKEMFTHIRAIFGFESLIIPINALIHAFFQQPFGIHRQQRIPTATPNHFEHIPTCTTEITFEFLNDFTVAAYWAIETLQVAVDDKNQIV